MANYTTSADILDDALSRAGELTDGTSDLNADAIRFLNRGYQTIWQGGGEIDPSLSRVWWWLRKSSIGVLTLDPVISSGTVNVTNNSASITFSATITPSLVGRHFKVDDHADVFIITAHTAGTDSATLDSVYTGTTDTAASYNAAKYDYDLASDVLYVSQPLYAFQDGEREISLTSLGRLSKDWPISRLFSGVPKYYAHLAERKIRFSHYGGTSSTDLIRVQYEYAAEPSDLADDSTEPLIPRHHRKLLADYVLMYLLDKKEDSRVGDVATLVKNGLAAMAKEHDNEMLRGSVNFARIEPRQRNKWMERGPLRTESGHIIG